MVWRAIVLGFLVCCVSPFLRAADPDSNGPLEPDVAPASNEPIAARDAIRLQDDWRAEVYAAEPLVANIVAFDIDHRGRIYVCESFRQNRGVTDNRGHDEEWLLADLSAKSVQDRIDYHKRLLGEAAITYAQHDDRIRRLEDTNGDGVADKSVVVANGFHHLEEGTGAGVLVRGNDILYTCIPKLWKLTDEDDDGVSDSRSVLSDGYGVRVAFRGHDLHGLVMGPDGRVYFSIGDRGYRITTPDGRVLADPASGAVFRCELDGSGLEVFARGLRNPQELAFNDQGDLFSVDNNSDSGDKARIVQILQDGDTGWRMYYQYLQDRGPFNRDRIWEPLHDDQPAYIVPPIANFTDGPSGLAYYPGTGFGDELKDCFLICDFRGGPSNSGIRSFQLKPQGATYTLNADSQPIWICLATDLAFGPDGAMYVSDWVDGWDGLGKGRIYRITSPKNVASPIVAEVQSLLASDWTQTPPERLTELLDHVDRRVRQESQWELARRGDAQSLVAVATNPDADDRKRLHAVWGLGQILRNDSERGSQIADQIRDLVIEDDPVLASAAIDILSEAGDQQTTTMIEKRLAQTDVHPRIVAHGVRALGRAGSVKMLPTVIQLLSASKNTDYAIRHAAIMYLTQAVKSDAIAALSKHPDRNVRRAAVCALRRQGNSNVTSFLNDSDPSVVSEAGRAIHDAKILGAMPALADLIENPVADNELMRRILNANFRLGEASHAKAIARFATGADQDVAMRLEALAMLEEWDHPDPRDRVLGRYDALPRRGKQLAIEALEPQIDLLMTAPAEIRSRTIEVAAKLGIKKIASELVKELKDSQQSPSSKAVSLTALARLDASAAVALARQVEIGIPNELTLASLRVLGRHDVSNAMKTIAAAAVSSDTKIRQTAWDILASAKDKRADELISKAIGQYIDGSLPADVHLNVVEASKGRLSKMTQEQLNEYRAKVADETPLGKWLDCLEGGDVDAGKKLFFGKTELSCVRCHKVDRAGGEVGPNLTVIGKERDRRYLLESICIPDAKIAKGFETAMIVDFDGKTWSGIVKTETDDEVELILSDGSIKKILLDDIEARKRGNSSMPADLTKYMTARELRDLVAYLASLQVDRRAASDVE